jgi:hypothetical protein
VNTSARLLTGSTCSAFSWLAAIALPLALAVQPPLTRRARKSFAVTSMGVEVCADPKTYPRRKAAELNRCLVWGETHCISAA